MKNKINLIDKYYFIADSNQFILLEIGKRNKIDIKTKKPTGEIADYEIQIGFFSTIEAMVKSLINICCREKVNEGKLKSLQECLEYMNDISENIFDKTNAYRN